MQPRIIIALLALVPFAAWSAEPAPPAGLAVDNAATPANPPNPKVIVAHPVVGPEANVGVPVVELHPSMCPPQLQGRNATVGAREVTAGFDGGPFVRAEFSNGEVRIVLPMETRVWRADGSKFACRVQTSALQETPAGSPPDLPADPMQGRGWMERHNARLYELISLFARGDQNVLGAIEAKEKEIAGEDLFKQITFRTGVVKSYIKAGL